MVKHNYLSNIPLDEALQKYFDALCCITTGEEQISPAASPGRITSRAVYAAISSPHYLASAMDGIAIRSAQTFGASETSPVQLTEADYITVDTGDPIPEGCDAVVMAEDCVENSKGILLYSPAAPWQHIRQIGEDIAQGDMLLTSYTKIYPAAAGALLAGGITSVSVLKKPRIAIIPTGDEVVAPSDCPAPGEVMDFNSTIFSGMLHGWGAEPIVMPIVPDDPALLEAALKSALCDCDGALLLAGTSAGRDDDSSAVISRLGEVVCHGIAIRPGKPAVLGKVSHKPVIGVPGYPVSGIVVVEKIMKPIIFRMLAQDAPAAHHAEVRMSSRLTSSLKYREFVRATLGINAEGQLSAVPLARGAGVVTSFVKADCIIDVPQNSEGYEPGQKVPAQLLKSRAHISRTVRITGSHDPLIDEAADLLRRGGAGIYVSSAHVGSMGGIFAVSRGDADMGGVHLLDEATGIYNEAYLDKFCKNGGVALIECVSRVQGLMVAKGNPKNIKGISDIAGLSYVNRQRGAGTRVLLDYLLKKENMSASDLPGYTREEMTHTAVAAQIAANTADCGLGIYSAAKIFGLDFIPVCLEQYDLLVALSAMEKPAVKAFLDAIASDAFKHRLMAMGGYEIGTPGRIRSIREYTR